MVNFSKKYDHKIQNQVYNSYKENGKFSYKFPKTKKEQKDNTMIFQLPFDVSQKIGFGNAFKIILQDIFVKYLYISGNNVLNFPFMYYSGLSDNKKNNYNQNLKILNKQKEDNLKIMKLLGVSMDFNQSLFSFSEISSIKIRKLFIDLVGKSIISNQPFVSYRSNEQQTILSEDEIKFQKIKGKKYNLRYFIDTKKDLLVVPTTNPETIFADVALAVNPFDRRYKKFIGSKVIIPIVNRVIPIIGEESIDMSLDNGIVRITPGHDEFSFQIATKHKLSTNKSVIDTNGNFTNLAGDFSGKKVSLFIDNIIQNLDDIHNLESVVNLEYNIVVSKKSGEKLYKLLSNQWVINFTDQINNIVGDIQQKKINIKPELFSAKIEDSLQKINKNFSFTKQNIFGHFLPIWKSKKGNDYLLDENIILSYPKKIRQNKNIIMTLIIFNLIADKRLSNVFYLNEFIELLFSKSLGNESYLLQSYLDFYKEKKISGTAQEIQELTKIISYADKQKGISNFEKFSLSLIKLIEKTFLITKLQNGKYKFEINFFAKRGDSFVEQETNVVDPGFINGLLILDSLGFFDEDGKGNEIKKIFLIPNDVFFSILKILLIGTKTIGKNIFNQLFPQTFIVDKKGKKIGQDESNKLSFYLREYGADIVRLSLVSGNISDNLSKKYDYQEIGLSNLFINKFWNAIRFIFINLLGFDFEQKIKKVNFKSIQDIFRKNQKKINIYDSWILYKLKELQEESKEQFLSNNILKFSEKLFNFVKNDFCEKYLEILKLNKKIDLEIMLFVVGNILKLLYPYVPFITEKLWELIGFKGLLVDNPINDFNFNIEKNYKIELFLEVIDKILLMRNNIKIKKHEKINVIFKTNPNFLQFLKSNEVIVNKLINAENIEYLDVGEIPSDYQVQEVIDVSVGIKMIVASQKKVENLSYWQEEIIKQNEYLQHLRNFISTLSSSGAGDSVIRSKKAEMMKIKEKIEELEFKISKFKSKNN